MKAFLSYPSEHVTIAREVKNFIRSVGVGCWFDKDDLVGGEDWDRARASALEAADVVLLLCAAETTERNGVYQRELNEALQLAKDQRVGTVYLIPLRIEDAPLPRELSRLQYIDYFTGPWKRKIAASLSRAALEHGETVHAALGVAAAEPDEGGLVPRSLTETLEKDELSLAWFNYAMEGDFWAFVNGVITARALGGLYEARRHMAEWSSRSGSSWEMTISEFYRKDHLVSLAVNTSSYFSGAAHPNHSVYTINILGERGGILKAQDLFNTSRAGFDFLTEYVNLDLKRQFAGTSESLDLSSQKEGMGWQLFDQFNFNEAGMTLRFSSAAGLPHVLGYFEVYLPWEHASQFLAPVARKILLGEATTS